LGLPARHARVIYNGIDTTAFTSTPGREGGGPLRALFVGRLVPDKGVHTAIEAVAQLRRSGREIVLGIAGVPGYPWDYATRLWQTVEAEGLGDAVRFLGTVPYHELPGVYRQHDVLVFPSIVNEGLPMTLLEAMACGLAVVGTTTGGTGEILRDGVTGLTCSPDDARGLADCLARLLHDPALCQSLADAGRRQVREGFAIETAVGQTEQFYQEVTERHAGRVGPRRGLSAASAR
jgi:glycosyltransferase involved in cell wall biosynthesis